MPSICDLCGKTFDTPSRLRRHQNRKTTCIPIITSGGGSYICRYCGRSYATKHSLNRHVRKSCKIANSDEGMDQLMDHTLARQNLLLTQELTDVKAQMATLTDTVAQLLARTPNQVVNASTNNTVTNDASTNNIVTNNAPVTNIVNIHPWSSGEEKLYIPAAMLEASFMESKRLREFCKFSDVEQTTPEIAAPYVLESLVDLTKRAHKDPSARNVYLNPRRADQVMVYNEASWEVLPLIDAIRSLFDSVAGNIRRIIKCNDERVSLSPPVQATAPWIPVMYDDEHEKYADTAKKTMSAHLQNTTPAAISNIVNMTSR